MQTYERLGEISVCVVYLLLAIILRFTAAYHFPVTGLGVGQIVGTTALTC